VFLLEITTSSMVGEIDAKKKFWSKSARIKEELKKNIQATEDRVFKSIDFSALFCKFCILSTTNLEKV